MKLLAALGIALIAAAVILYLQPRQQAWKPTPAEDQQRFCPGGDALGAFYPCEWIPMEREA